jgi:hypothetical protein
VIDERMAWHAVRSLARSLPYTAPECLPEKYAWLISISERMISAASLDLQESHGEVAPVDNSAGETEVGHSYGDLAGQAQEDDNTVF